MKILITGGTGLIGNYLVAKLIDMEYSVSVITRNRERVMNDWINQVKLIEADPIIPGIWMDEINGQDVIINLAGENIFAKRWTSKQKARLIASRVETTKNLVRGINKAHEKPKLIINASGSDFYPSHPDLIFKEHDNQGEGFLSHLTQIWEKPLGDLDQIRTVIFRFGMVFSKTGKGAERMFTPHKLLLGGKIGSGNQWYSWIHIEDVTGTIIWSIINSNIQGIFNGVAPQPMKMNEISKVGGQILNKPTWTWLPGFILKIILGERAVMLLEGRNVSSEKLIEQGYEFKYPTIKEALEDILA